MADANSQSPEPISLDDFNRIIDEAESNSKEGRIVYGRDLKKDVQSWR